MSDPCQNCGNPDADLVSFDMDLPNVRMCPLCSVTSTMDRGLFDQMGDAYRRRTKRRKP